MKKNASPIRTTTGTFATLALALCLAGLANSAQAQQLPAGVCTVTPNGTSTGTWLSPKKLEVALADASCSVLWLMQGTYTQTVSVEGFLINRNLKLFGGFTGNETVFSARPPTVDNSLTKLDGEAKRRVLHIDGTTTNGPITNATVIDGVSIQNGNAQPAAGTLTKKGGGIYCNGWGAGHDCSPSINNATFSSNTADYGGAIFNNGSYSGTSSPSITHSIFDGNSAVAHGGAMCNESSAKGNSSPTITHSVFKGNSAYSAGGALFNTADNSGSSSPSISNTTFSGNSAREGGAMYNAAYYAGTSSPSITNSTFSGNSASYFGSGGALANYAYDGTSSPSITNSTFSGNSAHGGGGGGAMYSEQDANGTSKPTIIASIFWGNTAINGPQIHNNAAIPNISYSIVQGSGGSTNWDNQLGTNGSGNLDADPLLGPLADSGGPTQTMMPGASSPANNAGGDTCPPTDQRGIARKQGIACDMGAVETRSNATLEVTATIGGSVSVTYSSVAPINGGVGTCSSAQCSATYALSETQTTPAQLTLGASSLNGYAFANWSNTSCDGSAASICSITMDASKSVTATFAPFTLSANKPVNGTYGTNYFANLTPTHTGGVGTVSYAQTSSTHPDLVYDPVQGTVSGPATIPAGTYSISITATDSNGATSLPTSFSINIDKAAQHIAFNSNAPSEAKVGGSYTVLATPGASSSALTLEVSGPCSIAGNVVTFNATGPCTITAKQLGDMNYLDAVPATRTVQVVQGASGVNISSTPNPSQPGQAVTFTVSVALDTTKTAALKTKAAAVPTGTVSISDNGTVLGSAPLVNGLATVSTQLLTKVGSHSIVASYSGDANYPATTSVPFAQTVTEAAVTPVATPVPTLNEWALIGLTALLALFGASRMRKRSA